MLSFAEGINKFNEGRNRDKRDVSFDYCYNYFYSFRNNPRELASEENMEKSCLQLGFYLASWGMMRGSSFLLKHSSKYFETLIKEISNMPKELWGIDLDNYTKETVLLILKCKDQIKFVLGKENKPSDTLISKIMLGIFANVPAYDRFFKDFLKDNNCSQSFNKKSLQELNQYYLDHKDEFDNVKIKTFDFNGINNNYVYYTKAKLLDMYGFICGLKKSEKGGK